MDAPTATAAIAAARRVATRCGLSVETDTVLHDSNRLTVRLLPCDVVARVAPGALHASAEFEVAIALLLGETDAPVAPLDSRVEPRVFDEGGFAVTLWAYCDPVPPPDIGAGEYAGALVRLHAGMRSADVVDRAGVGHFMDRVAQAQAVVDDPANNPAIAGPDRELVSATLRDASEAVLRRNPPEQLLHGEPHPGNLLRTNEGLLFVDLETCCRGPIEFDIAHATIVDGVPPVAVADRYAGSDPSLVLECWRLTLALAVAWRCEPGDDLPDGEARARAWIRQLRAAELSGAREREHRR